MLLTHGFALLFTVVYATPHDVKPRAIDCSDPSVKSLVSTIRSFASTQIDPFCSSYLHYSAPSTTVTVTASSVTTVTSTTTKGTTTVTVTTTQTGKDKRDVENELNVRAPQWIAADSNGRVAGFPSDIVSGACSCLVTKPTKTSTITKTSTKVSTATTIVTVKETKTITVTTRVSTTKSTSSKTSSSSKASSTSSTKTSSTRTSSSTTTASGTLTTCASANPTFYIQFKDQNPARTDVYNNRYLTSEPDTYRGVGTFVSDVTANKASAELVIYDKATGWIRLHRDPSLIWNVEFFLCLTPMYFDTQAWIEANEWQPLMCTISGSKLSCNVLYPCFGNRKIFETCPEYDGPDAYYTPLAFGDQVYTAPDCYGKDAVIVPYCTPKT